MSIDDSLWWELKKTCSYKKISHLVCVFVPTRHIVRPVKSSSLIETCVQEIKNTFQKFYVSRTLTLIYSHVYQISNPQGSYKPGQSRFFFPVVFLTRPRYYHFHLHLSCFLCMDWQIKRYKINNN